MAGLKKPADYTRLYQQENKEHLHDKKIIESLIQRLNEKILRDPKLAKKAALIIENWLQQKSKK